MTNLEYFKECVQMCKEPEQLAILLGMTQSAIRDYKFIKKLEDCSDKKAMMQYFSEEHIA